MQVATLFRESSTLLGAAMESGGSGVENLDTGVTSFVPGPLSFESYHHSMSSNKYKLNMKLEPHEDGYKNKTDMLVNTANVGHSHEPKCEKLEDPYSFIDDDPIPMLPAAQGPPHYINSVPQLNNQLMPGPKKRGRKKRNKSEGPEFSQEMNGGILRPIKERKKHDRFNGMPEEEVSKRTLPDHLSENLDIIIIGINPGLFAAYKGHHYAGPGNHFWKCLYLSGLTPQQMSADEDYKLLQVGIGFTNMVQRATKGSADLTRKEIKEGSQILLEKLRKFKPKIAVFNGKLIFEVFSGKKDFKFGRQPDVVEGTNTHMWVMPSSSARCAQLPRAADKVPFYTALKKFRDYLNGLITEIDENEMVFSEPRVKSFYEAEPKPEPFSPDLTDISNAVIHNDDSTAIPYKKKRGRPKKSKVEGEEPTPKPAVKKPPQPTEANDNCNFPKKKRGRPKKIKVGTVDQVKIENNTSTNVGHCYSNLSPMRPMNGFYQMGPGAPTPNGNSNNMYPSQPPQPYSQSPRPPFCQSPRNVYNDPMRTYNTSPKPQYSQSPKMESQSPRPNYSQSPRPPYSQSPRPPYSQSPRPPYSQSPRPPYSQSPRPHSQPFTHSDLSSEISAAISSEQLSSPIGPPDFEPLTNMEDEAECRLESPSPSTNSEQSHYYHQSYNMDPPHTQQSDQHQQQQQQQYQSPRPSQDIASKSLSGLESLVDQIPSLTEGEGLLNEPEHYTSQFSNYNPSSSRGSPVTYNCPPTTTGYPIYPTPTWSSHYEPIPFGYPQLPYGQGYGHGLPVPGPDYPYYSYSQPTPTHPPGYPSYLGGF